MARSRTAAALAAAQRPLLVTTLIEFAQDLWRSLSDSYRPEQHYMRGPGPAWQAKHATARQQSRS